MRSLLARCRIRCQIAVLGVIGMVGVAAIAGLNFWGTSQTDQANATMAITRQWRDLETQAQIALLGSRRHEKDFLLHRDDQSISLHAASTATAEKALDGLSDGVSHQPGMLAIARQMLLDAHQYTSAFGTVIERARTIGLNENQGLLGQLRTSVHDVEEKLKSIDAPAAQIAMLMMRRHEKDFIARLDPKYGAELKARLPAFIAAIDVANAAAELKQDILAKMNAYQASFASFMSAMMEQATAIEALSTIYAEIEPRLVEADRRFREQAEAAQHDADSIAQSTHSLVLVAFGVILVTMAGLCWVVGRRIANPIVAVTRAMDGLVSGDLSTAIPADNRHDEIGTMIRVVGVLKESLLKAARMHDEQAAERALAEREKRGALNAMAERIEAEAAAAVTKIGDRTASMSATVEQMRALAGHTNLSAESATAAAALALGNAQTVASAAEELSASIREISGQVVQSNIVVGRAVVAGNNTRITIEALNERVGRIDAVAAIISDIASKTNLLALNATIEAARAGEAGKGFAVVASEVKQLANQTARSTEEITRHVNEIRAATDAAVNAVRHIETTIAEVNAIAGSIAAAVDQQGAATAEIARNVTGTATAANQVTSLNAEVSNEAQQVGRYADDVLADTRQLDSAVQDLRRVMIRTVRESTAEVNRRASARITTDLACRLKITGKAPVAARMSDISEGGARLTGAPELSVGTRGTLAVGTVNVTLPFTVTGSDQDVARITFTADKAGQIAVRSLLQHVSSGLAA